MLSSFLSKVLRVLVTVLLVGSCARTVVYAQSPQNPAEIALAREQFTAGVEAARRGSWAEARSAFERSYALYAHPETLFNIAGARLKVGALVAAAEAYRGYVRVVPASTDPTRVGQAKAALAEIEPRIAHATLNIEALQATDALLLDDMRLSRAIVGAELPVDPGTHQLVVQRGDTRVVERSFSVGEGEHIDLHIVVPSDRASGSVVVIPSPTQVAQSANAAPQSQDPRTHDDTRSETPLRKNVWLWSAVGVAVVSGALATWFLTRDEESKEVRGNVGTGVVEIR